MQLIPAPAGMYVLGKTENGASYTHIVPAFALTVDKFGTQRVQPIAVDCFGDAYFPSGMELRSVDEDRYSASG